MTPIRSSIIAGLGVKALIGSAAVALAAGATGMVMTGSVNPAHWGQQVSEKVEACEKARDANKDFKVGECVSDFAKQHGPAVRAQHSEAVEKAAASPSPKPGQREGHEAGQTKGANGATASDGKSQGHAGTTPTPTPDHGHDKASPHP